MSTPNNITPIIPITIDEETGTYDSLGIEQIIKIVNQNLKMVLLTSPKERIMHFDFGVGMKNYLFEQTQGINGNINNLPPLREKIISQISTYIPYITLQQLDIINLPEQNGLAVKILYFVNNNDAAGIFELTVDELGIQAI